jgi:hypothetical protein
MVSRRPTEQGAAFQMGWRLPMPARRSPGALRSPRAACPPGTEDSFTPASQWPFEAGAMLTLGGTWRPTDTRGAAAMFEGVYYPEVFVGFTQSGGTFSTPSVLLNGGGSMTTRCRSASRVRERVRACVAEPGEGPVF